MLAITSIWGVDQALAEFKPVKLISIVDPGNMIDTPDSIAWHYHLKIQLHDFSVKFQGMTLPHEDHIARLIEFGGKWRAEERLLIHCQGGVSRSAAGALILLCQKNPGRESEVAAMLRERAHHIRPNWPMIDIADRLLNCRGRLVEALREMPEPTLRDPQGRYFEFPTLLET